MSRLRVIQWNISTWSNTERIATYLESLILEHVPTVVCLQEVTSNAFEKLETGLKPTSAAYSLDRRPPGKREGKNRRMGLAILAFNAHISEFGLLERTLLPERSLWAQLDVGWRSIRVLSFHSLTGVGYKNAKVSNFATIADYLENDQAIDFLCFDANEPQVDSRDIEEVEFWKTNGDKGRNAALIMGSEKVHSLTDAYRSYVEQTGSSGVIETPVTHYTRGVARRYDYVFASARWKTVSIAHPLKDSLHASSDHSAVIVDFEEHGATSLLA